MALPGGRLRKQRQVQHARELRRKLAGTVSGNHHGTVRRVNSARSACPQRIQKPTLLGAGEPGTLGAGGAGATLSLRVVIFQQALRPLRQHLRKTARGGVSGVSKQCSGARANRLRRAACANARHYDRSAHSGRQSLSLLTLHLLGG